MATKAEALLGKIDLGMKLTCESCGGRYYDLTKNPAKCPKCGTSNARPIVFKTRRPAPAEDKRPVVAKAPEEVIADVVVPEAADDEDEAVIEDTSDLGEDDSDVEVVVDDET